MRKHFLIAIGLAIFLVNHAHAITQIISTNKPAAWESCATFGLTLTSGNSDSLLVNSSFKTHRLNPTNELTLGIEGAYGENDSVKNAEMLHSYGQYNHLFTDRVYGYGRADGLHDGISDVSYRATVSPGAGYYFVKSKETTLAGEFGPGGVFEKVDGSTENYAAPRVAERLEHKVDGHARFWENMEFLPQLDQTDNFLVNSEVGVEAPITKRISLSTVLQDNFANVPAPGHKDNDVKLVSGLVFKF
jgi:putative salt-induced outer membrane protein YdiY